jgi:transcriptional regulator with XRE-family HTH domain
MTPNRLGYTPIVPLIAGEIRAEMARSSVTVSALAERLGMGRSTLSRKLNQDQDFTSGQLDIIADSLGLTASTLIAHAEARRQSRTEAA